MPGSSGRAFDGTFDIFAIENTCSGYQDIQQQIVTHGAFKSILLTRWIPLDKTVIAIINGIVQLIRPPSPR